MSEGVDYAFSRPSVAALVQAGKQFACRYGGVGTSDKWLSAPEAQALSKAGIAIVANVEGVANGLQRGYSTGWQWAARAHEYFTSLGMPPGRPIYLSADWDVSVGDLPAVRAALLGARDVLGPTRVGLYGGRRVIEYAQDTGLASWLWQTYAWSGRPTHWVPGTHIQQYHNGVVIGNADCDLDRSMTVDFGQWTLGGSVQQLSEWHDGNITDSRCTQGGPDQAGQQRDTLLASAAGGSAIAAAGIAQLLARPAVEFTPAQLSYLAEALRPVVADVVADVLSRLTVTFKPNP
jgi:hypothetical protein